MTDAEKLEALLAPVKANFRNILDQDLPVFTKFKQDISQGEIVSSDVYDVMKKKCHKIKGSSKTLGFEELGEAAAELEKCIGTIISAETERVTTIELNKVFDAFLASVKASI